MLDLWSGIHGPPRESCGRAGASDPLETQLGQVDEVQLRLGTLPGSPSLCNEFRGREVARALVSRCALGYRGRSEGWRSAAVWKTGGLPLRAPRRERGGDDATSERRRLCVLGAFMAAHGGEAVCLRPWH